MSRSVALSLVVRGSKASIGWCASWQQGLWLRQSSSSGHQQVALGHHLLAPQLHAGEKDVNEIGQYSISSSRHDVGGGETLWPQFLFSIVSGSIWRDVRPSPFDNYDFAVRGARLREALWLVTLLQNKTRFRCTQLAYSSPSKFSREWY